MNLTLRPYRNSALVAMAAFAAAVVAPQAALAQATEITQMLQEPSPLLATSSSKGYLGVLVGDVDSDSAAKLKLKDVRGAVITLVDHDAPAGQAGLKVNDVVVELNGQPIEGAEQLRRMLHEIPPGRKITLVISHDGTQQTVNTQMGDHKKIVEGFWTRIGNSADIFPAAGPGGLGILPGGDTAAGTGLRFSIFGSSLKVGAMVEPLTTQMAEYLGVASGLMVKQVGRKTEADTAGLKAFDVILKVGPDPIATMADWERALHANQGKPVQLTILRDKKQQTLTMQVDSKHSRGELEMEDLFSSDDCPLMAELDPESAKVFAWDGVDAAEALRAQAEALRDQLKNGGLENFKIDPKQAEEFQKQAEKLRDSMKGMNLDEFKNLQDFKVDSKQLDDLKRQMNEWQKSFNPNDFKLDQKQLDELKKQMEQWRQEFKPQIIQLDPQWI
jgi:serine protease Do